MKVVKRGEISARQSSYLGREGAMVAQVRERATTERVRSRHTTDRPGYIFFRHQRGRNRKGAVFKVREQIIRNNANGIKKGATLSHANWVSG